jgi:quercetin dioxygenase-like cupin family protein
MATMTAMRAKAPTLVWLLTALSCLLVGMAIVESRQQFVAPPVLSSQGPVETTEAAVPPTATPEPIPSPILGVEETMALPANPRFEDIPVPRSDDPTVLRTVRLTVPAGARLPPEGASGPTALLVESGTLSVWVDNLVLIGQEGNEPAQIDAALGAGDRLAIPSGARYAVRNDGPTAAMVLVVAIAPGPPPPDPGHRPLP